MAVDLTEAPAPRPVQSNSSGPISEQDGTTAPAPQTQMGAGMTPVLAPNTGGGATSTLKGVNPALATTIAKAIALGIVKAPTNDLGWAQIVDKFQTTAGENEVALVEAHDSGPHAQPQPGGTAGSNAPFTASGSESQWAATVLARAGVPQTQNNVDNMMRWMTAEEPSANWSHADNPLNINAGGSGFDTFQSLDASATATANVLKQSNMNHIWQALAGDANPDAFSAAVVGSPWAGSHYGGDPNHIAQIPVPAGTPQVAPPASQATTVSFQGSSQAVKIASAQLGTPYVWGGEDPSNPGHRGSFDCSGLVQWVYGQAGEKLPRVAQAQYDATPKVAAGAGLQPGDLLFFGAGPKGIEHVGIYIGNGQMINAPHTGADVRVDQVFAPNGQPLWGNFVGATRPGDPTGQTTAPSGSKVEQAVSNGMQNYGAILQNVITSMARYVRDENAQRKTPAGITL